MRKLIALVSILAMVAAMTLIVAAPASAALHPIQSGECAQGPGQSGPEGGDPPGQTPGDGIGDPGDLAAINHTPDAADNGDNGSDICPNA